MFTVDIDLTFRMSMPDLEQNLTKMLLVDLMKGIKSVNTFFLNFFTYLPDNQI
jgi:hypothetical protein